MGSRHSREQILQGAVAVLLDRGVTGLSFASVGAALGMADRTVVYYFPTKAQLLWAAVEAGSATLRGQIESALGDGLMSEPELLDRAWGAMSSAQARPWMRVYLELVGAAAHGGEPQRTLAHAITTSWVDWVAGHIDATTEVARSRAAREVVATIDGRLILSVLGVEPAG